MARERHGGVYRLGSQKTFCANLGDFFLEPVERLGQRTRPRFLAGLIKLGQNSTFLSNRSAYLSELVSQAFNERYVHEASLGEKKGSVKQADQ